VALDVEGRCYTWGRNEVCFDLITSICLLWNGNCEWFWFMGIVWCLFRKVN